MIQRKANGPKDNGSKKRENIKRNENLRFLYFFNENQFLVLVSIPLV